MTIGYFATHFPYDKHYSQYYCGGMEVAASNLVANMLRRGHDLSVFTTSIDREDNVERYNGLTIYRYGKRFSIGQANMSLGLLYKPLKHDLDIVHAHAGIPPAPIGALRYSRKKKKPLVVTYHGDARENWGGIARRASVTFYNKLILHMILSHAKAIISPAEHVVAQSNFLTKYRYKIVVIPNGINIKDFDVPYSKQACREKVGLTSDESMLLFVGALSPDKGLDVLIGAMPKIIEEIPDSKLVIIGDGMQRNKLEKEVRSLGLDKHIRFEGFVGDAYQKALYYHSADVFVLPSIVELFGIVNLEAMACGIPIVASRVGGIPDLVEDGKNGLLVPPKEPDALANAVVQLLQDRQLRNKMSGEGIKRARNYSWERIAEETAKVYERVSAR